jgi:phage shock protein A
MSGKALIESIARSAEKLIGENRKLRSEVDRLEASRERLRRENHRLATENATLERRLAVKELAAGFAGGAGSIGNNGGAGGTGSAENTVRLDRQGTKIARARVNRLMREVDRCIALLHKED